MNYNQQNYIVKMSKLLANANRVRIIDLVSQKNGAITVSQISNTLNLEINLVSNQLVKLRENSILKAKQSGTTMLYEIKDERIIEILKLFQKIA
jgi:DNA-binding transcriptional ArsR family regulator